MSRRLFIFGLSCVAACFCTVGSGWYTSVHSEQVSLFTPSLVAVSSEAAQVRKAALLFLNTPGYRVSAKIEKVVVLDGFALLDWSRGEMGGQILLKKKQGIWQTIGRGGGVMNVQNLVDYGVPQSTAQKLISSYQR